MSNGHWKMATNEADIEKFCAQAKMKEFAANKTLLQFGLDLEIGPEVNPRLDESGRPLYKNDFEGVPGALVPLSLFRNKDSIIEAFRACKNLTEFRFSANWKHKTKYPVRRRCPLAAEDDRDFWYYPIPFNIVSSVAYVLSLAEEAGIRLEKIVLLNSCVDYWVGLSDAAFLSRHKDVFQKLKCLDLHFAEFSWDTIL
jgi:hypothetical protein